MAIEDIREPLTECAGHFAEVEQLYTEPVQEQLAAVDGHLTFGVTALQVAIEEFGRAKAAAQAAHGISREAGGHANQAKVIVDGVDTQASTNHFIADHLERQGHGLAVVAQELVDMCVVLDSELTRGNEHLGNILKATCINQDLLQENQATTLVNGQMAGAFAEEIRRYLKST